MFSRYPSVWPWPVILSICLYGCESCMVPQRHSLYRAAPIPLSLCAIAMSRIDLYYTCGSITFQLKTGEGVGFRFDKQLRCPTSITMASACKPPDAFWSPSQAYAIFVACLSKMQRCRKDDLLWQSFDITPKIGLSLLLIAKVAANDQMTILLALSSRMTHHTPTEYIHAPPLFLCSVAFLSYFGESWNLVGINYPNINIDIKWCISNCYYY